VLLPLGMRFPGAFVINIISFIYDVSSMGPFGLQGISVSSHPETDADLFIYMCLIYIYTYSIPLSFAILAQASKLEHFGDSLSIFSLHFIVLA